MEKYKFKIDASGDYRLFQDKISYNFSPRAFAQNFFYKLGQDEPTLLKFKAGDDVVEAENVAKYPVVTDIKPSQNTAGILKNLLFGQDGILTGHLTYLYQNWIWATQDKEFAKYLKELADNDGMILDAIGNIIVAFGGDPNFMTTNSKVWSASNIISTKSKQNFLQSAIAMEERSIKDLEMTKVENESLTRLLNLIKQDKQKVVEDLKKILATTNK